MLLAAADAVQQNNRGFAGIARLVNPVTAKRQAVGGFYFNFLVWQLQIGRRAGEIVLPGRQDHIGCGIVREPETGYQQHGKHNSRASYIFGVFHLMYVDKIN